MRSQLRSRVVVPPLMPNKLVWTAPLLPTWQMSLLFTTIDGLLAVGGALSTTVELLLTVALVTVSVAYAGVQNTISKNTTSQRITFSR
jgi:hypothetical protein